MANLLQQLTSRAKPLLNSVPIEGVQDNRERLAVVVRQGLDAYETYRAAQPWLLAGGIIGAAASGFALYKRRQTAEAYPLYIGTFIASLGAIWLGIPSSPAAKPAPGAPAGGGGVIAALDAKRAAYTAADPQWVNKTYARLRAMPDVAAQLRAYPALQVLVG